MTTPVTPNKAPTREDLIQFLFPVKHPDNIYEGREARRKLYSGIQKGVDVVRSSYGAAGSNAIISEFEPPFYRTTNDGKMLLENLKLEDEVENIGLHILREVSDKSDKESGDGRKSAVILTGAILKEGFKASDHPMEIKKSLEGCLPIVKDSILRQTKKISIGEIGRIAEIASENEEIGNLFQEIYGKIGAGGMVDIENSGTPFTEIQVKEGVRLTNCRLTELTQFMANDGIGKEASYLVPKILITKEKISAKSQIERIMNLLKLQGIREMVIFYDDMDLSVMQFIWQMHNGINLNNGRPTPIEPFKVLAIKAPVLWKDWIYEDFAKITGATIITPSTIKLKDVQVSHLGTCDKIVTTKEETRVIGIRDIKEHMALIAEQNTDDSRLRLSRLNSLTGIIKLGADSETALAYKRAKASDARSACYLALQGGVVAGGGMALFSAIKDLPDTVGGNILKEALRYPLIQIIENSGWEVIEKGVRAKKRQVHIDIMPDFNETRGWDAKKESIVDMFEVGILDPSIVVVNSFTNALSVASTVLTAKTVITRPQ